MSGTTDKIKGKFKEMAGKVTGNRRTEAEGKTDQVKGDIKNAGRDAADAAKGVGDSAQKR